MKKLVVMLALGALLSMSCGGGGGGGVAPSEVTLEYKSLENADIKYKANTNIDTNVGGQTSTWLSETRASVAVVDMPDDGSIVRSLSYTGYTMGSISGTGSLSPDPTADEYIGENVQFTISGEGVLTDWRGLDGITGMTVEGNNYTDFIMQQLTEMYQPFPDRTLKVGDTWQRNIETSIPVGGGDLANKIQIDYELVGFGEKNGRNCANIETEYSITGSAEGRRRGRFWIDVVGEGSGEIWFDYTAGVMVEFDKKVTITRELRYERAGEEDVATKTTSIAREFKVKMES